MNILFYVEQYPLRESYTKHVFLVKALKGMIEDEFVNKHYSVHSSQLKMVLNPYQREEGGLGESLWDPWVIPLTEEEKETQKLFYKPWSEEALQTWQSLMRGEGEVSDFSYEILSRVKKYYDFDVVVYWGTNGAVKKFAKDQGIPAISFELGCTRPPFLPTIYVDHKGVNGNSYTQQLNLEDAKIHYDLEHLKDIVPRLGSHIKLREEPSSLFEGEVWHLNYMKSFFKPLSRMC